MMTSRQNLSEAHFVPALAIHAALSVCSVSSILSVLIRDFPTILEIWAVLVGDIFQQGARSTCPGSFTLLARVGLLAGLLEHLTIKSIFVGQFNFHSEVVPISWWWTMTMMTMMDHQVFLCWSIKLPLRVGPISWWSSPAASSSGSSSHQQHSSSPAKNDPCDWSKVLWQVFWLVRSTITSILIDPKYYDEYFNNHLNKIFERISLHKPLKKILVILGEDLNNRRLVVAKALVNSNAAETKVNILVVEPKVGNRKKSWSQVDNQQDAAILIRTITLAIAFVFPCSTAISNDSAAFLAWRETSTLIFWHLFVIFCHLIF